MGTKFRGNKTKVDNQMFDSEMEARYYKRLKILKTTKEVTKIILQPEFILQERFTKNKKTFRPITYTADFLVHYADGRKEVVDVKGRKDPTFNLKYKLFEFKYPKYSLRLLTDALNVGDFIDYKEYLRLKPKKKASRKGNAGVRRSAKVNSRGKHKHSLQQS